MPSDPGDPLGSTVLLLILSAIRSVTYLGSASGFNSPPTPVNSDDPSSRSNSVV